MVESSDKIFVGGLPKNCSLEAFSAYFGQFGNMTDVVVMKDRDTGESRGFGFVVYDRTSAVDDVMAKTSEHRIQDKWVDVKRATPKGASPPPAGKGRSSHSDRDGGDSGKNSDSRHGSGYGSPHSGYGSPAPYGGPYGSPYGSPYGYGPYGGSPYGSPYGPHYGGYGGGYYPGYSGYQYPPSYPAYRGAPPPSGKGYTAIEDAPRHSAPPPRYGPY